MNDQGLVAKLRELVCDERRLRVEFIVYLAEFERRQLHLRAGFPSVFAWLTDHLGMSKASAFRRIAAARLQSRMPAITAYLREGRLSLTKLCYLKDVLAPENCLALLEQAASLPEKDVEALAVVLDPDRTAAPRDSIRPVAPIQVDLLPAAAAPTPVTSSVSGVVPTPAAPSPAASVRHLVKMTVGPEFLALLEEIRAALSHSHPNASLETLLATCMKIALRAHSKRVRGAADRPRPSAPPSSSLRSVSRAVRRAVWERDGGRCTFVAVDGRRCDATRSLQLHHVEPVAFEGAPTVENIRLVCRGHNDYHAREDFGHAHMNRFTRGPEAPRAPPDGR